MKKIGSKKGHEISRESASGQFVQRLRDSGVKVTKYGALKGSAQTVVSSGSAQKQLDAVKAFKAKKR